MFGNGFIANVLVGKDWKFLSVLQDNCKMYNLKRENSKCVLLYL